MIHFVLNRHRLKPFQPPAPSLAYGIKRLNVNANGPADVPGQIGNREAPFPLHGAAVLRGDAGIDENDEAARFRSFGVPGDVDDCYTHRVPHLGRRQADTSGVMAHGVDQILDEPLDQGRDALDRTTEGVEEGIGQATNRQNSHAHGSYRTAVSAARRLTVTPSCRPSALKRR